MSTFFTILVVLLGIFATIYSMIFIYKRIMPTKNDGNFTNPWYQKLHNYFHFKKFYIESVLRFFFTLSTVAFEVAWVAFILRAFLGIFTSIGSSYFLGSLGAFFITLIISAVGLVVTPILIRFSYEFTMMFVLLVQNISDIKNKINSNRD